MYCVYKNYYISDPLHFHSQVKPEIKSMRQKLTFIGDQDFGKPLQYHSFKTEKIMEAIIEKVSFLAQKLFLSS